MYPAKGPSFQKSTSGVGKPFEALASIAAVLATFVFVPFVFKIISTVVRTFAVNVYGPEWSEVAVLLSGLASAVVVYWGAYMMTVGVIIKFMNR